jgi:hypothetical protein
MKPFDTLRLCMSGSQRIWPPIGKASRKGKYGQQAGRFPKGIACSRANQLKSVISYLLGPEQ